jgi:2-iminobutanoate/2-iminopropanoate deaminase
MKKIISTKDAPEAIGPYSQAVKVGNLVFTAGQIALMPETNTVVEGDVAIQTEQVLRNLKAILNAAGTDMSSVVKTNVYLTKPQDFAPMNEVYATYFTSDPPARVTVFVSSLPKNVLVEIDAVAEL